jgi:Na+/H+ antiporter NhaD/arsenite permease-like protein
LFGKIDYALLLTFIGFFVFIGNMGRVPVFNKFLADIIDGNEVLTSVISSQVISNVPAALLLSGFTDNVKDLIIGTNLGGLGTLIASMASLISYKFVAKSDKCTKGAYIRSFTVWNLIFLAVLMGVWIIIK